jgi:hypothetical protein
MSGACTRRIRRARNSVQLQKLFRARGELLLVYLLHDMELLQRNLDRAGRSWCFAQKALPRS